ncbi:DEAD/DEAH box helicase [Paenibacillus taihuensis]|uniref:DEAD/DEAH box helicase n=1 Tax=Paenibacillus taihuensis TaxID=1156355 RepID=UPI001FE3AAB8|nr:helicase-related protein [Paenibacillus taihuensis]
MRRRARAGETEEAAKNGKAVKADLKEEAIRRREVVAVIAWSVPIPLGHAVQVAERWSGKARDEHGVREEMARLVREAWASDVRLGLPVQEREDAHAVKVVATEGMASGGVADAKALAARACRAASLLQGRALLSSEALALLGAAGAAEPAGAAAWSAAAPALQLAALLGLLRLGAAVAPQPQPRLLRWRAALGARPRPRLRCQRCGSGTARMRRTACAGCGRACAYCEACLTMGRSRECGLLIFGTPSLQARATPAPSAASALSATWALSPAQAEATAAALRFMLAPAHHPAPRRFLFWAVTGAGKTEMIYPLIEAELQRGGRALIATPRRDVVLELDPRIRKAFRNASVVTLYGGSDQRWEQGEITIATTHQLFRFQYGFDLVIIDEIDAFPYHNDPMLQYAAEKVCKPGGVNVLLSATPPAELRSAARSGCLSHVRVPVRFHRHPLPIPKQISVPPVHKLLKQRSLPRKLVQSLQRSITRGAQLFLFVQQIREVEPLVQQLRSIFPDISIEGTSSKDGDRAEKVLRFRDRTIRLLVTTTILERGVTIPKSDVFILDADGKLFDDASLIQMAGRAGRSSDDPAGRVYFFAPSRTRSQQSAIRQIRMMNRIAKRKGFLITHKEKG